MKDINLIETIKMRRSVRTFAGEPVSDEQRAAIEQSIAEAENPFGGRATMRLVDVDLKGPYKPGTYGVIKGARNYLLMGIGEGDMSALSAGYMMEQVVLDATAMGLGTCWIAATFKGSDFSRLADMPADEPLRIISPVGVAADRRSMLERLTRTLAGSNSRKPFSELFFQTDFSTPLAEDSRFGESLAMLRLAPSSTNSQPWRAVVDGGDTVHFYYKPVSRASVLDLGIGLCHFAFTERSQGQSGRWMQLPQPPVEGDKFRYLISYSPD